MVPMPTGGVSQVSTVPTDRFACVPLVTDTNCTGCVLGGPSVVTFAVVSTTMAPVLSRACVPAGIRTAGSEAVDFAGAQHLPCVAQVIGGQCRAGQIGFNAAGATTVAGGQRKVVAAGKGQRIVSPLAGDGIGPGHHLPVDDDAATDAGP